MVEKIFIEPGAHQPKVLLDPEGNMHFEGRTIVANAVEFYEPIIAWAKSYFNEGGEDLIADFKFDYINTASHKMLLQLFIALKELESQGLNLTVNWFYFEDDEDILEFGEEAEVLTGIKFNLQKRYS